VKCRFCGGEAKYFARFQNRNCIVRRFRCTVCGKTFSESQPLEGIRVQTDQVAQVVSLLCEGMGVRATSRLTRLHQETILNILEPVGPGCLQFHDKTVRNVNAEDIQTEELYAFVHRKQEHKKTANPHWGEQYTFLSIDRDSKLILSFCTGKRTSENAHDHLGDLKNSLGGRIQLSTDNFRAYLIAAGLGLFAPPSARRGLTMES
jgi:transposase-like protein